MRHSCAKIVGHLCILLVMAMVAWAGSYGVARAAGMAKALYDQGDFEAAAEQAARDDPLLAAKSLLACIYYQQEITPKSEEERVRLVESAILIAKRSIANNPHHVEGYLQLVIAYGHKGQNDNPIQTLFTGLVPKTRKLLMTAKEIAPDSAWLHGLEGGWNLELVRKGGRNFAKDQGASVQQGLMAYRRALALDPRNPIFKTEYALSLLLLDQDEYREAAAGILSALDRARQSNAVERLAAARGMKTLALINANDSEGLEDYLDYIDRLRALE